MLGNIDVFYNNNYRDYKLQYNNFDINNRQQANSQQWALSWIFDS